MFSGAYSFNGDISEWDVSGVTDMSRMFAYADSFNGDISEWDVSGVTDMSRMFAYADSFNGDISEWDVSCVTGMSGMFAGADAFDQNLGKWVTVLDFEAILTGGRMHMEGSQVVRSLPRPCGFSDFHPAAAPAYPSPEAASTM